MSYNFDANVSITLQNIVDSIEENDPECLYEIDFDGDIVTITKQEHIWIINKHSAAGEIWLASSISGPYHFAPPLWKTKKDDYLFNILKRELNIDFKARL